MIQMTHVFKTYPKQITALSDVTLGISPGEFTFIVGPNSSGKTTLLRILYGAERPTSGEVIVNGLNITQQGFSKVFQLRRGMGIVFQNAKLLQDRTVSDNIALALEATGQFRKEVKKKVAEVLAQVGLQEKEKESILALSAGEQQRVVIARALVNDPCLFIVDEPTGNLDDQMTSDVMQIFISLNLKGKTVVFATHDGDLAQRYSYRAIHLLAGRMIDGEKVDQVRTGA